TMFKDRESDKKRPRSFSNPETDRLAQAKVQKSAPLALGGIRIDGTPHEILGIRAQASPEEIQQAYRDLLKRYHPDTVGRPGSREWQDAQKIAEALNRAKDALLKDKRS